MGKVRVFVNKRLGYDPKKTPHLALNQDACHQSSEELNSEQAMGSFMNHMLPTTSSFLVDRASKYHLNRHWVLDGGSDIHICNKSMLHLFNPDHQNTETQKIVAGATEYSVEAWGTCRVNVYTPKGNQFILLKRTAYIPDFMTSLVSLSKITSKDIHWSSRKSNQLEYSDGSIFCWLFKSGEHIVFEPEEVIHEIKAIDDPKSTFTSGGKILHPNSRKIRHKTFSKLQMHRILGHCERVNYIVSAQVSCLEKSIFLWTLQLTTSDAIYLPPLPHVRSQRLF
ncbi:hypothetical protein K3495_g14721 [Podosphaera aphanis]|nr:hypothetical protein K3495_g14721 [Podosphaera aphanis]